jgi:hypothetical protein
MPRTLALYIETDAELVTLVVKRPKRLPRPVVETSGELISETLAPVVDLASYRARRPQGEAS